jgi:hypothetical protein
MNIKHSKTKIIFRFAFLLILIYVSLTMYTNGVKSFSDVLNYKPYIYCPENLNGLPSKHCFNPYYNEFCINSEFNICPKEYLNAGESLGTKPNIFYETGLKFIFGTIFIALYINWLYLKRG